MLARHADALMALPGVVGVAQGLCDGKPCIHVLVARKSPELASRIPATLDGYRVEIRETGAFHALGQEPTMSLTLTSTAFTAGAVIPVKHTCDGPDVSPPLAWSGEPANTKTFALIMDDPDAPMGTWVHWVLWNLPGTQASLPENVPKTGALKELGGALQGNNTWPKIGYYGPCPPPGKPHRYFFKLYALDGPLDLKAGATKADVERAMQGHVLGQAQLMGTYGRKR